MNIPQMGDQCTITFAWAMSSQLEDVWELQDHSGTSWSHPKGYFAESIQYQRLLLAHEGSKPVAFLVYEVIWGNTAFLALLKVLPAYQRKSIGKSMIAELEKRLIELGFKSYVTSSETTNPNTKRFFPDLGFTQIGELQMHHGGEIFYLKVF